MIASTSALVAARGAERADRPHLGLERRDDDASATRRTSAGGGSSAAVTRSSAAASIRALVEWQIRSASAQELDLRDRPRDPGRERLRRRRRRSRRPDQRSGERRTGAFEAASN